ncbi:MAG: cytochrome c-type biogenesis protein CcmH [Planktotalea sp.]|jgi:cytochrome c-type biogenesis protein CcmH|uniref:cytochrome c-type biogenesis protein n=1 Tax=Planktotalea sp. TaxID=2029877 RepID=UPI00059318ED|nr:cytochrome c-type biogenesis protein [Planktotalea sp.]MBT5822578.1 cytochrome c-type biogenesis protein CcmH [Paracoccaceae bacterium]MDG1076962.1 cytochrome c-type biogenesis protein CcmH [Planktotalea sp.]MDG1084119.1 cytochrome c-type biogenesis protein CcmH [Planktotalea sp.]HCW83912.1 cytochrome c-type biogenesis protein CcmH [Paracoccaceae bacterium]
MRYFIVAICMLLALPLGAVQPDEVLDDPVLEQRARDLSKGLRCLVCQNESIDESDASLARDLRILLRERLVQGDTDEQAISFIVDRYGEYVLLRPTVTGSNWLLWAAGPLMLLMAGGVGFAYLRGRDKASEQTIEALSDVEKSRLAELLNDD